MFARAGAHIQQPIGGVHDLRIVLDHQQGISGIAQAMHDADHAGHVAWMQADRRLIEYKQRIDQRGPQRGGEIDSLHLAAG